MPSKIRIQIRAELHRDGKLIKRLPWKNANSLLKQFIQVFMALASQAAQTIKDTAGADQNYATTSTCFDLSAALATTNKGIVIGTGTAAVTMTDYKLQTQVTANVVHGVVTFAVETPDANTWRVSIARVLTNNTGASLAIREVALYHLKATAPNGPYCIDRTLYSVDVPNGVGVTLTYRITVTL